MQRSTDLTVTKPIINHISCGYKPYFYINTQNTVFCLYLPFFISLNFQRLSTAPALYLFCLLYTSTRAGEFVVCNLASLCLGNIDVTRGREVEEIVSCAVRALDNVIDLNFYPLPYAKVTNRRYRSIGLGVSGYHHMLAKHGIRWESEEHIVFADQEMCIRDRRKNCPIWRFTFLFFRK